MEGKAVSGALAGMKLDVCLNRATGDRGFKTESIFRRYHINVMEAPPKVRLPPKFIVKQYNNCINLQECIEACIYGVHRTREDGQIAEPISDSCRRCHVCTLVCPKGAISIGKNQEYEKMGTPYFTPDRIETIYFEAETGRVPVSGAGYGGPFAGRGFDGMWFDFSEIVRPTRDGIHGREYISTSVDLGRNIPRLEFDGSGTLLSDVPRTIEIPMPIILDAPLASATGGNLQMALAKAASASNTFAIIEAKEYSDDLGAYASNLIPRIRADEMERFRELMSVSRIVEIDFGDVGMSKDARGDVRRIKTVKGYVRRIKDVNPSTLVSFRFPYDGESGERAEALVKVGADIAHFFVDDKSVEQDPEVVKDDIKNTHSYLIDKNMRDGITLVSSGGIAEASHVPKSIILGADVVSVGLAYQIALGCKACYGKAHAAYCPINVGDGDVEWATQRLLNLMSSWRDQLLEILGGMGLREVRRQRGEFGRVMFNQELEDRVFGDDGE